MSEVTLSYDRRTVDSPNPVVRFAHRSRMRTSIALADAHVPKGGRLIDFGAGTGTFLSSFAKSRKDISACAIEPYQEIADPDIEQMSDLADVASESVDAITCLEVCEHLTDEELDKFLADAHAALKPTGRLIVTVPIMYGLTLPVKEGSRMLIYRNGSQYSAKEMIRAVAGRSITRSERRQKSHKGFDFRWLRGKIERRFKIVERQTSPFGALPWWLNSQAIMVCARR
ncbi:MAG: class I SAM-dependent methyltransferase [Alteraurantiacibacter sp.]